MTPEWAFVLYNVDGEALWHQRLVLGRLRGSSVTREFVATPDGDVYEETADAPSEDIAACRRSAERWPPPPGVPRARVYRFARDPTQVEWRRYLRLAEAAALAAHRPGVDEPLGTKRALELVDEYGRGPPSSPDDRGWPATGSSSRPPAGPAVEGSAARGSALDGRGAGWVARGGPSSSSAAVAAGGGVVSGAPDATATPLAAIGPGGRPAPSAALAPGYFCARKAHGLLFGDPVVPTSTVLSGGDGKALIDVGGGRFVFGEYVEKENLQEFLDSALADDARVLPLRRSTGGVRERSWASVAEECSLEDCGDWPLTGPRSTAWCLAFIKKEGRTLELHHERFRALAKVEPTSWGMAEHKELCSYLSLLALYDQIDVVNSAAAEAMFRRLQTIEYSYMDKIRTDEAKAAGGTKLSPEEQAIFGGFARTDAALMVAPSLLDHARVEAERSAALAKNLRKAREEREAAKKK